MGFVEVKASTDKAILVEIESGEECIAKSQIVAGPKITGWLANKLGLL